MALVDDIIADIDRYLRGCGRIHFNERDLQIRLAMYLRATGRYDDVDVEYYVPRSVFPAGAYIWNTEMKVDIVVKGQGEYVPIELKYKTQTIGAALTRFDEYVGTEPVLKYQAAQNMGKYDVWKDVRRLELLRRRFKAVRHGVVLFLTNDKSYTKASRASTICANFAMDEGHHSADKSWAGGTKEIKGRPDFKLNRGYDLEWHNPTLAGQRYYYTIVRV